MSALSAGELGTGVKIISFPVAILLPPLVIAEVSRSFTFSCRGLLYNSIGVFSRGLVRCGNRINFFVLRKNSVNDRWKLFPDDRCIVIPLLNVFILFSQCFKCFGSGMLSIPKLVVLL